MAMMTDYECKQIEVELIDEIVGKRCSRRLSQQRLADISGVAQAQIARLENLRHTPKIDTLIKVLKPLGYKLLIVKDIELERK